MSHDIIGLHERAWRNPLKSNAFQIGTFGTQVTERPDRLLSALRHAIGTGSRPLHPPCRRPSPDGPHRLAVPPDPPLPLPSIGLPAPDLCRAPVRGGAGPQTAHHPAR